MPDSSLVDSATPVPDTGMDSGPVVPCNEGCPSAKPVCDESSDECVQCTASNDDACKGSEPVCKTSTHQCVQCTKDDASACKGSTPACKTSTHECVQCTAKDTSACKGDTPKCDTTTNECVQCLQPNHCTDPLESRCLSNECIPCNSSGHCTHLTDTPVCDESQGKCVECSAATEVARCGGKSCNRETNTCTDTVLGSVLPCNTCLTDSECTNGTKCIEQLFGTGPSISIGKFCFFAKGAVGCAAEEVGRRPYSKEVTTTSVDGAAGTYCLPVTTCQAYLDASLQKACGGAQDCGATGLDDGYCNSGSKCTYSCNNNHDCPATGFVTCSGMPGNCQ
jgi:hypothetical protein